MQVEITLHFDLDSILDSETNLLIAKEAYRENL